MEHTCILVFAAGYSFTAVSRPGAVHAQAADGTSATRPRVQGGTASGGAPALACGANSAATVGATTIGIGASAFGDSSVAVGNSRTVGDASTDSKLCVSFNLAIDRGEQGFSGAVVGRAVPKVYVQAGISGSTVRGSTAGRLGFSSGLEPK